MYLKVVSGPDIPLLLSGQSVTKARSPESVLAGLLSWTVQDPLAPILAGDDIIASERVNKEKNAVYPVVAVRTRWIDDELKKAMERDPSIAQVWYYPPTPNHAPLQMNPFTSNPLR
jgi:hypothetical protein